MEIEYNQSRHIKALEGSIARLEKDISNGDESAIVERAWAMAFLKFVKAGHRVMDLPWFDHLRDSGKDKELDKAA